MRKMILLLVIVSVVLVACGTAASTDYQVTYKIGGSKGAAINLTYANETGATVQEKGKIPWEKSFKAKGGSFLYVSAQLDDISIYVNCLIAVDGKEVQKGESKGKYTISTCKGTAER